MQTNVDNAIRMRVQTADKNITMIHTTQVCKKHRNPLRHFNWKKISIIQFIIHNSEKVCPLLSSHIKILTYLLLQLFSLLNSFSVLTLTYSLLIQTSLFTGKGMGEVKNDPMMDLFLICYYNMRDFASQDINWWSCLCGLLVDYCDVFISCLNSYSDGTHSQRWDCEQT